MSVDTQQLDAWLLNAGGIGMVLHSMITDTASDSERMMLIDLVAADALLMAC